MDKLEEHVIQFGAKIKYIEETSNLGRAEFTICTVFKRGFIRELYIYHLQQEDIKQYHVLRPEGKFYQLGFSAFRNGAMLSPNIWVTMWCKEHKCHSLRFYVPDGCNSFQVVSHWGENICLEWGT